MKFIAQKLLFSVIVFLSLFVRAQDNLETVGALPVEVSETSGLIYFNESFITHNDSGNGPVLFELDTLNLSVKRTVTISNADNVDWEAITQDENFIYIGDFGNNVGIRTDLTIYRIAKTDFVSSESVVATVIWFSYEDQTEFVNNGNSDWDAEAFFVLNDQLILFTKQWQSFGSVAYTIPKTPGTYTATRIGAIDDIGLVTDVTYNPSTKRMVVLGYSSILSPFIGIVPNLNPSAIFEDYAQNELNLAFVQAEGITQIDAERYFFSSEFFSRQNPTIGSESRLFSFQIPLDEPGNPEEPRPPVEPENPEEPTTPENPNGEDHLVVYKDSSSNQYYYFLSTSKSVFAQIIFDALGRAVWQNTDKVEKEGIIYPNLQTSIYYLALYLEDGVIATPFAVY